MTCVNITEFVLINELEKDHSMIETRCLKNVVIFIQTIYVFIFSRGQMIRETCDLEEGISRSLSS